MIQTEYKTVNIINHSYNNKDYLLKSFSILGKLPVQILDLRVLNNYIKLIFAKWMSGN